jgi:FKBP-type peptidyl-prolyl cis-trans isomerase 2
MNDETLCIGAVVVAILMVGGLALLTWWDERDDDDDKEEEILLVREGDEVSVDYTGRFLGSGGELGPIFDTSIPEDARNDSLPKSKSFQEKPTYDDLTFTVGSGQMIAGFDKGVLGMSVGSVKYITVEPEDGYGLMKPELILDIQSKSSIPLQDEVDREDFVKMFPNIDPEVQDSFIHPFWGWEIKVVDFDPATVTILNQPIYLEKYGNFPWNVTVTDISTSRNLVQLSHNIEEINISVPVEFLEMSLIYPDWAGSAIEAGADEQIQEGYVTTVGGIITIDFNREVVGKTLVFKVIMNDIKRGGEEE